MVRKIRVKVRDAEAVINIVFFGLEHVYFSRVSACETVLKSVFVSACVFVDQTPRLTIRRLCVCAVVELQELMDQLHSRMRPRT